jgi:hypothetical protein
MEWNNMARQSAIWNEWLLPPSPPSTRGVRVTLTTGQEQDEALGPYTIVFQYETTAAPGFIAAPPMIMTPQGANRFVAQWEIPAAVYSSGGNVQYAILDASGEWGGNPDFAGYCVVGLSSGGFMPAARTGAYTIKDFTLLNSIERLPNGNFKRRDLDFINMQLLSLGQAAVKMRELAASADPNLSLQFRARADKMTEYNSRKGGNFGDYLNESARIIEFAVNEIRNNQRFDLTNIQFSKTIL